MEEKQNRKAHSLQLTDRKKGCIQGVRDVNSFDEKEISLVTEAGTLSIKGEGLHVGRLNLEEGEVAVEGRMDALTYAENMGGGKQSFFAKLFR